MLLRVLVLVLVAQGAMAESVRCRSLLSNVQFEKVTVEDQVAQTARYESLAKKKFSDAIASDLNVVGQILNVYNALREETLENMQEYTQEKRGLDEAISEYLAYRFGTLSEKESSAIRSVLTSVVWKPRRKLGKNSHDDLTAVFDTPNRQIHFEMPEYYRNTLVHWFLMMHELEHAIQFERLRNSFDNHDHVISPYALNEVSYLSELGAMTAEWTFLHGVNQAEIKKALELVKSAPDIEESYRQFFIRALTNAHLPLETYLALEHEAGRYSREVMVYEPEIEKFAIK